MFFHWCSLKKFKIAMMDPASLRKLLRQLSVWNAPGATCLTWEHVQIHIRDTGINAHAHNFARISLRSWLQLLSCWLPLMECNGSRCSKQPIAVLWDGYDIFISYIIYIYDDSFTSIESCSVQTGICQISNCSCDYRHGPGYSRDPMMRWSSSVGWQPCLDVGGKLGIQHAT